MNPQAPTYPASAPTRRPSSLARWRGLARGCFWGLPLLLLALAGCVTERQHIYLTGDPLVDGPNAIANGPARDKVLWQYRMSAAAMRKARFGEAKQNLDSALARLAGIFGPDKNAKRARGLFHEESKKTFLGEPYERAMAYYYRGILYWMDGELDNARACFRSGQYEDSDTEDKQYAGDYVLFDYLDGLATTKLGNDGSDTFKRAQKNFKFGNLPPYDRDANVLFFLEMGKGPTKFAAGEYHEELHIRAGRSEAKSAYIKVGGQTCKSGFYDDVSYQATTRGGRVMDHILANKAVFKSATDAVGSIAMVGGAAMAIAGDGAVREAGIGLAAFGLLSKVVASATTAAADTRDWDNLPQYLGFASLKLPPGEYVASVEFFGDGNRPLPHLNKQVKIKVATASKDVVVFVSDQSINPLAYE